MKTTISRIKALKPHSSGYQNLLNQLGSDFDKDKEFELSSLVGGKNTTGDITWLLGKTNNKRALVEFAVFSAELVLPIYEKMNDSKAPREAIELVKKWLNNESSVTKQELRDTAYAAATSAYAVAYPNAAYTTYIAAAAAAYATYAASYVSAANTVSAAYIATTYAAAADFEKQINDKLIEIIDSIKD